MGIVLGPARLLRCCHLMLQPWRRATWPFLWSPMCSVYLKAKDFVELDVGTGGC